MTTVREHQFDEHDLCQYCGDARKDVEDAGRGRACIAREAPRAVPASVFADLGAIGDRLKEIKAEEESGRLGLVIEPIRIDYNSRTFVEELKAMQERIVRAFMRPPSFMALVGGLAIMTDDDLLFYCDVCRRLHSTKEQHA